MYLTPTKKINIVKIKNIKTTKRNPNLTIIIEKATTIKIKPIKSIIQIILTLIIIKSEPKQRFTPREINPTKRKSIIFQKTNVKVNNIR